MDCLPTGQQGSVKVNCSTAVSCEQEKHNLKEKCPESLKFKAHQSWMVSLLFERKWNRAIVQMQSKLKDRGYPRHYRGCAPN